MIRGQLLRRASRRSVPADLQNASSGAREQTSKPRIALYSHDTVGLGHLRRNLLLAQTLRQSFDQADILLITGAATARAFAMPNGVDALTLPGLAKADGGGYRPRSFGCSIDELVALRSRVICTTLDAFEPDAFIVDNVPRGALGELDPVLKHLRRYTSTRCILGLRDVLDDPGVVQDEWNRADNFRAVREFFDAVWVYGDPDVYNVAEACGFPSDVAERITFTGYLDGRVRLMHEHASAETGSSRANSSRPLHLCVVGGGQDGRDLAELFAHSPLPKSADGLIVTGPYMPPEVQQRLARVGAQNGGKEVVGFLAEPTTLYHRADRIVSMGGYNTVCELLTLEKHPLIVPRVHPRREQLIRAERLSELGLVDLMRPEEASPQGISDWLHRAPSPTADVRASVDFGALHRIPRLLAALLPNTFAQAS